MYKHILSETDGSELAQRAVTHGLTLAKSVGAQASFVTATKMWSAMEMTGACYAWGATSDCGL
jgi:nucleotide-binding universal stress UspA family protein